MRTKTSLLSTALLGLALSFCAASHAGAQVVVRIGPPAPVHEVIPPPREGYVWQPGYHRWDGNRYVWVPGAYAAPPRPHAAWIPGHWSHRGGGYVWVDGHWR